MKKQVSVLVILFLASLTCFSQRVHWKAYRFTEENDFFNLTQWGMDRYYTQGARLDFFYETQKRKFSEHLLIPASTEAGNIYSVALTQQIYTPRRTYDLDFVGDMPYSGTLYFTNRLDSYDTVRHFRIVSSLDMGMIGPVALGKQVQGLVHKIIHNRPAAGWDRQQRNDLILNYSFQVEKRMVNAGLFSMEAKSRLHAGTSLVSAIVGLNFKLGTWNKLGNFNWEVFFQPEVRVIGYNALLQGGVFNRLHADETYSQYFLKDIYRLVYSHSAGIQIRCRRMELLYQHVSVTRQFKGQTPHYFGHMAFTCRFKKR